MLWKPSRAVRFALFGCAVFWITLLYVLLAPDAYGQEEPVRHYRNATVQDTAGFLMRSEVHFVADSRTQKGAVIIHVGEQGAPAPSFTAVSSGYLSIDVSEDGDRLLCIIVTEDFRSDGQPMNAPLGRSLCMAYDEDADALILNDRRLDRCRDECHGCEPDPSLRGT